MASSQSVKVAVAGVSSSLALTSHKPNVSQPGGTLGESVIRNLVKANFDVTALTRDPSNVKGTFPTSVKFVKVDYDSVDSIVPHIHGQDAVVDLINRNESDVSIRLIDAAIAAKVPHFIPSSFGLDQSNPEVRKIPATFSKRAMEDYLFQKGKEGAISYTAIETAIFLDWAIRAGVYFDLKGGSARTFNGGDVKNSASLLDDIGKAVATALTKRESDEVRNKVLFMRSTIITNNQLLAYAREGNPSKTWEVTDIDAGELEKKSWEAYNNGDRSPQTMRGFIAGAAYGKGLGLFTRVDNDILGIEEMSEQALKDLVAKFVA